MRAMISHRSTRNGKFAAIVKDSIEVVAKGNVHLVADGNGALTARTMTYRLARPNDLVCKFKLGSGRY